LSQLAKLQAGGKRYIGGGTLSIVPGVDGVGFLPDGRRVYFAFPRAPFGVMAETTVIPATRCVSVPDQVDDVTAAGRVRWSW
jgi:NADPH:quinone reductase-like Zn-dependent oxidoreductase